VHASDLKENKGDLVPTRRHYIWERKGSQVRFQNGIKGSIEKRDKSREKSREKFRKEETKQQNQDYQRETDDNDDGNILRDYIDQERESMRRSTSRNQRSSYGSRMKKEYLEMDSRYDNQEISRPSVGKTDKRYQEIVNKYLGKGQSEREIAAERIKQSSKQVGLRTKYQEIFEIKESDTAQVELTYFPGTEYVIDKKSEEV